MQLGWCSFGAALPYGAEFVEWVGVATQLFADQPKLCHRATDFETPIALPCSRIIPMMLRLPAELRLRRTVRAPALG